MYRPRFARQFFFFLLAVLLPSAVLVVFGVVFMQQQRELAANRAVEERIDFARDTGRLLEQRLNEIALIAGRQVDEDANSMRYPAGNGLLWMGRTDGSTFEPAWSGITTGRPISWGALEPALREAERLEFRTANPQAAANAYRNLANRVRDPRNRAVSRQRAARTLLKAGRVSEAVIEATSVLETPSDLQDEHGVPLAYYAADLLLSMDSDSAHAMAGARLIEEARDPRWFSVERTYMLRDLMSDRGDSAAEQLVLARAGDTARIEGLRTMIPGLLRSQIPGDWDRFGDALLGTGPPTPIGVRPVFGINAPALTDLIGDQQRVEAIYLEGDQPPGALPLVPYLRDASVSLAPGTVFTWSPPRVFFVLGLTLLLGVTLFGGYLLWRDVRRETRLSRLRAQFVSSVSHELRTPLTSIRMFADTMMLAEDAPAEERRRYLNVISNESERLTRMLNNVLNASRVEQGTMTYRIEPGEVRQAVHAAVDAMKYAFEQQQVPLEIRMPETPFLAMLDPDALEQAVLNLLSNALKYGGGKPVVLTLEQDVEGGCRIDVTDRGPGISSADQEHIFERFFRSESAQNQRVAGTGLGLALVRHIVEAHGGRIEVVSAPDRGSTFSIHLPTTAS